MQVFSAIPRAPLLPFGRNQHPFVAVPAPPRFDLPEPPLVGQKPRPAGRQGTERHDRPGISDDPDPGIQALNADARVDGILLQLPLPGGLDETPLLAAIDPEKDADGLHTLNLGRLLKGEPGPRSCTPAGVMAMLRSADIDPAGQRAVVIGRSILVGQPMALMLQAANATVTVAHSRTRDLAALTRQAEILVVAAGRPEMLGAEHVSPGTVVVDVGIHRRPEGGLCGDVRAAELEPIAAALSPVPGGVGPMTVTMLLVNTVVAWCRRHGVDHDLADLII